MANIEAVGINKVSAPQVKATEAKPETKSPVEIKTAEASASTVLGNYGKAALNLSAPSAHNTIANSYMEGNKFFLEYADGSKRCLGAV